jgi:hypothetical protein
LDSRSNELTPFFLVLFLFLLFFSMLRFDGCRR